jgi:hypothetical protein
MALEESSQKASRVPAGVRRIGILPDVPAGSITRIDREDISHSASHGH